MPSKKQRAKALKAAKQASANKPYEAHQAQLAGPTPQTVEQACRAKTRAVSRQMKHGFPTTAGVPTTASAYAKATLLNAKCGRQLEHRVATSKRVVYRKDRDRLQQKLAERTETATEHGARPLVEGESAQ